MTYILPGNLTKLDSFTLRMMTDVLKDHETVTDHGSGYCCEVAKQYQIRVEAHHSIVADEMGDRGTSEPVDKPLTPRMANYIQGLYRKCPGNLLSPTMREQADKVVKHEEISFEAAKALIDAMKAVTDAAIPQQRKGDVRMITPPMVGYLRKLLAQREHEEQVDIEEIEEMPFKTASEMIDRLKNAPFKAEPKKARYIPEDGFYCCEGTYYKVVTSERTGNTSARVWDATYERWEYVGQRPFKFITAADKLTAEQAKGFSALYGRCVFCAQQLTDEESIERGFGPICAEKNGF